MQCDLAEWKFGILAGREWAERDAECSTPKLMRGVVGRRMASGRSMFGVDDGKHAASFSRGRISCVDILEEESQEDVERRNRVIEWWG